MKNRYYRTLLLIISLLPAGLSCVSAQKTLRVLFIGNSYTATNNLPQMIASLALSLGDTLIFDSNTPGGYTFQQHSTNTTTLQKIQASPWDFVVLQEQSQMPSFPPSQVQTQVYPYAEVLDSLIHANDSCTRTMFYMTWGRKYGDASNCANYAPLCTYEGMSARLRESYSEMAQNLNAEIAPVGPAWWQSRLADSTFNLYSADNSHPAITGTYLAACVFYEALYRKSVVGATFTAGLTATQATYLQNIAHQTTYDSLSVWNIHPAGPQAGFYTDSLQSALSVSFTNFSTNADHFLWMFGDQQTSTASGKNISHTYTGTGSYEVLLVAYNGCETDTFRKTITITTTGLESNSGNLFSIFPNPASEILHVVSNTPDLPSVTDLTGRIQAVNVSLSGNLYSLDVQGLSRGVYMVRTNRMRRLFIKD
jgi:hypothetical protein